MFKRLTSLYFALAVILALPFAIGCAGRPPAPVANEKGETYGLGEDGATTVMQHDGEDVAKTDGMLPIN